MSTKQIEISSIRLGERHRRDLGDIDSLADSITAFGLLQPIVIDTDNLLLAGERRLKAVQKLGWTQIDAKVVEGNGGN